MNKIICASFIYLLLLSTNSFSQTINLSTDSIATLLCKKWEVDYAMMGNMKIRRIPSATEINFEFYKDKSLLLTSNDSKVKAKGTWAYDTKKKIIKLTVNGNSNSNVISLKEGELIMLVDTKEATPDDPMDIKMVYKIKTK